MKINEIINEAEVKPYQFSTPDINETVRLLNEHCSESVSMIYKPLWRGMSNHTQPVVVVDPSSGERKSQNTTNQYTMLMDHCPGYDGWPKRSKSFICSTDAVNASVYSSSRQGVGGTYALFPFDGVKIAVCPLDDMWDTHVNIPSLRFHDTLGEFNKWTEREFDLPEQWNEMSYWVQQQTTIDKCSKYDMRPEQVLSTLVDAMHPDNLKMKLMSIQEYSAKPPTFQECWVGGPMVAVKRSLYRRFLSAVKERM